MSQFELESGIGEEIDLDANVVVITDFGLKEVKSVDETMEVDPNQNTII